MKKLRIAMFFAVIAALLVATGAFALFFNNGSFESGSWTPGWDGAGQRTFRTFSGGYTGTGYPNLTADGTGADLSAVVGGPAVAALSISDPNTATVADPAGTLKYPAFGHYSARINSQDAWTGATPAHGKNANTLYQTTTVDALDVDPSDNKVHLRMMYAVVLVEPGSGGTAHTVDQVPMFFLEVKNVTKGTVLFHDQAYVGDPTHTWQTGACLAGNCAASGTYKFLDWTLIDTIAGDATIVGDTLSVEVIATGCSLGGHAGYVYVDEIGSRLPGPMLSASAPATTYAYPATYTYTVEYTVPADRTLGHLSLNVPTGTTYNPATGALSDALCSEAAGVITCDWPTITTGTHSFTFDVKVNSGVTAGTVLKLDTYSISAAGTNTTLGTEIDTLVVAPPNDPPVAVDDTYLTQKNTLLNGTTVLVNDTDADLNPLTAVLNVGPTHSSAFTLNANGTFSYTPTTGFVGTDTFTYHANDGTANSNIATVTINVIAPLPDDWTGSGVVESDKPIVTVVRPQLYTPAQISSYAGFGSGALKAYLPMMFKNAFGGSYDAAFYVQNVDSATTANITIDYYDAATGAKTCTDTDTVGPLASNGYWLPALLSAAECAPSGLPDGWIGSVVVTSTTANIVAVGRPHVGNEIMTYNGFSAGATTVSLPMLFRQSWGGYEAAIYIQNVGAAPATNISIKFRNQDGSIACTKSVSTLAPLATTGYWLKVESCLPIGWAGGAVITSTQNIVALARPHVGTQITAYSGFTTTSSTSAYVPMLFKKAFTAAYNSALYVQNLSGSPADVTIAFYTNTGSPVSCTKTVTLAAWSVTGYWLPAESCLTDGWAGGALITSTQPVTAVARPHRTSGGITEVTAYPGLSAASLKAYLPMLFKKAYGSYESALYVQNVNASPAAISIKFYDLAGNVSCVVNETLPAFATNGYWLPGLCLP